MAPASRRLQPDLVKVRADLTRALALVDSRDVPAQTLDAIGDAHHALTVAIARLEQADVTARREVLEIEIRHTPFAQLRGGRR